jgi:hypothetical protein
MRPRGTKRRKVYANDGRPVRRRVAIVSELNDVKALRYFDFETGFETTIPLQDGLLMDRLRPVSKTTVFGTSWQSAGMRAD